RQRGELSQPLLDVIDAIIAGGGMVGGLGERYTRVAAAHAVHNGLTVLPQTEKFLHGTKVAYGILVQSALLGQDEVLAQLVAAYRRFNLPTTLAELDIDIHNRDELDRVITHTLRPVESIHFLPVELTPQTLYAAFVKVENFRRQVH
ncbi:MAG TPA: oxidoreductase, partial [Raoultella sp.]|nr:oxidoreductase [Raoultella sp.]